MGASASTPKYTPVPAMSANPPPYTDIPRCTSILIQQPGEINKSLEEKLATQSMPKPLTQKELLALRASFDKRRKDAYEAAYTKACTICITYINNALREKMKDTEFLVMLTVGRSADSISLIVIEEEFKNKDLEAKLIKKVYEFIRMTYKDYVFRLNYYEAHIISFYITNPVNSLPFTSTNI